MPLQNLPEDYLYELLPSAVLQLDEQGLIEAVVGGVQDHLGDLRSYTRKLGYFYAPTGLPDGDNNVVLVTYQTDHGIVITVSLDFMDDTPPDGSPALLAWASGQTGVDADKIVSAVYGRDLLRLVDANTLDYLATTIGAVLYQSAMIADGDETAAHQKLVETYFPRLRFKGTALSFEALGRALGFDDVAFTPLWSRVSARRPDDIGNAANDPDFSAFTEYEPQQELGPFYNPLDATDGPFYTWTGTVSNGTAQTDFYTQAINGFSPFITAGVTGSISNGTIINPDAGVYLLSGGAPHTKASVTPEGSSITFYALVEGDSFNGMPVSVEESGTNRVISITGQLSALKYRSSYFDLSMAADPDKIEELFGSTVARPNVDLQNGTNTPDGVAVSPYRPWVGGSISVDMESSDWMTRTVAENGTTVVVPRHQATNERQLNFEGVVAAASQVVQAMDEVRPATRIPRQANGGLLLVDDACYAAYVKTNVLFNAIYGTSSYSGSSIYEPLPDYVASIQLTDGVNTYTAVASSYPANGDIWYYSYDAGAWEVTGTFNFDSGTFAFNFTGSYGPLDVVARWTPTTTEVIRVEPDDAEKVDGNTACLHRPEDDVPDDELLDEVADVYDFRAEVVAGGELIDVDDYQPIAEAAETYTVSAQTSFFDQSGAELDVLAVQSSTGHPRLITQFRATDGDYTPGGVAIAFSGTLKSLSSLTSTETGPTPGETLLDIYFEPGAALYHAGLVDGVLVVDPVGFNGPHHRDGLTGWYPLDEHAESALAVLDHAANSEAATISGLGFEDRVWSDERGWFLKVSSGGTITSETNREATEEATLSFWIEPGAATGSGVIVELGPVEIEYDSVSALVSGYVTRSGGGRQLVGSALVSGWTFVCLTKSPTTARFGSGSLSTAATFLSADADYADGEETDTLNVYGLGQWMHDLRCWNQTKTDDQLQKVLYPTPTPTIVNYLPGFITTVNRRDRYGMTPLPSGWIKPTALPGYVQHPQQLLVNRYQGGGLYQGESRRKEVGLGGGRNVPETYQLGQQYIVNEGGTSVYSTDIGAMPGINDLWASSASAGTYAVASPGYFFEESGGWRYRDDGSDQGTAWRQANFDDSTWVASRAPFGFGVGNEETLVNFGTNPSAKYLTTYYRGTFRVESPSAVSNLIVGLERGEGAIVYINGVEVVTSNMPSSPTYLSTSLTTQTATQIQTFLEFAVTGTSLVPGDNVLAVEVHLSSGSAARSRFDLYLVGTQQGYASAGTNVPWPSNMEETNPCREYVWVVGNDGYVYEVTLSGTVGDTYFDAVKLARHMPLSELEVSPLYAGIIEDGTYFQITETGYVSASALNGSTASVVVLDGTSNGTTVVEYTDFLTPEQPTGAEVLLTSNGSFLSVDATGSEPVVLFLPYTGTLSTPDLFMYLNNRIVINAPAGTGTNSIYDRWTDKGNTAADQHADTSYMPSLVDNGTIVVPLLGQDGQMEFDNSGVLAPGSYQLEIESGNVGQTDTDFNGFAVEITVDAIVLQKRLLAGMSGYNIRGTDVFDFTLSTATEANWILSILWTNAFSDSSSGTRRQLAVYSYRIRKTATELYQVGQSGSLPTATRLQVELGDTGTIPGGWLNFLSSYGTLDHRTHEAILIPVGDPLSYPNPDANLLTGATNERVDDIFVINDDYVLPDDADPMLPSFGTLLNTGTTEPTWVLAGGITPNPSVKLSARLPIDAQVRAVVSSGTLFNDRIYSGYAVADSTNNRTVQFTVDGLENDTRYYYALEVNGVLATGDPYSFKTPGTGPYSFKFAVGGCENNVLGSAVNNLVYAVAAGYSPDFFLHLGDLHYQNIGYPDMDAFLAMYDTVFSEQSHFDFYSQTPLVYVWDDHDTGPDGADRTNPAKAAAQAAYRAAIPSHPLPVGDTGPIYRSFRWGRCQFIITDNRSEMSRVDATDNVNKSVLGAVQKAWFKQEVLKANNDPDCRLIFWVNSFPFTGDTYGQDNWQSYQTERRELCDFFYENNVSRLFIVSGDMHAQAVDDGRSSDFRTVGPGTDGHGTGYPVYQCAPLWQNASQKGTPYLLGPDPISGSALTKRVTIIEVTDDDDSDWATVTYRGLDDSGIPTLTLTLQGTDSPRIPVPPQNPFDDFESYALGEVSYPIQLAGGVGWIANTDIAPNLVATVGLETFESYTDGQTSDFDAGLNWVATADLAANYVGSTGLETFESYTDGQTSGFTGGSNWNGGPDIAAT